MTLPRAHLSWSRTRANTHSTAMFYPWINQLNNQYTDHQHPSQPSQYQNYQDQNQPPLYPSIYDRSSTDESALLGDQSARVVECELSPDRAESIRNERERRRVKQVNAAFALLRAHLPHPDEMVSNQATGNRRPRTRRRKDRRISKVKTLRQAIQYINDLLAILGESESHQE